VADALELALAALEPLVAARGRAAADVADVDDEGELLGVHALDHPVEPLDLAVVIGRIAEHAEDERVGRDRRRRRAPGEQKNQGQTPFSRLEKNRFCPVCF
jgi:hypothetical protein